MLSNGLCMCDISYNGIIFLPNKKNDLFRLNVCSMINVSEFNLNSRYCYLHLKFSFTFGEGAIQFSIF